MPTLSSADRATLDLIRRCRVTFTPGALLPDNIAPLVHDEWIEIVHVSGQEDVLQLTPKAQKEMIHLQPADIATLRKIGFYPVTHTPGEPLPTHVPRLIRNGWIETEPSGNGEERLRLTRRAQEHASGTWASEGIRGGPHSRWPARGRTNVHEPTEAQGGKRIPVLKIFDYRKLMVRYFAFLWQRSGGSHQEFGIGNSYARPFTDEELAELREIQSEARCVGDG